MRQSIGRLVSSLRRQVNRMNVLMNAIPTETVSSTLEMGTHADTCVMGATFYVYENTAQQCTVYPYSTSYKPKTVMVAHGGTAYDHSDGHTYILDVNYGFNMTAELNTSLLNPNQLRANGVVVDDVPLHLSSEKNTTHSIFIPELNLRRRS